jgi:hypothetical protein
MNSPQTTMNAAVPYERSTHFKAIPLPVSVTAVATATKIASPLI